MSLPDDSVRLSHEWGLKEEVILMLARRNAWEGNPVHKEAIISSLAEVDNAPAVRNAFEGFFEKDQMFGKTDENKVFIKDKEKARRVLANFIDEPTLNSLFEPSTDPGYCKGQFGELEVSRVEEVKNQIDAGSAEEIDAMLAEMKERIQILLTRQEGLQEELRKSDNAAQEWRAEAKRRQRISILLAIVTFILGTIVTLGIQFLLL